MNNRIRLRNAALLLALAVFSAACVKEIDFNPGPAPRLLVVNGRVTTNPGPQFLRLSLVTPFGESKGEPLSGAKVRLLENAEKEYAYSESPDEPGLYLCDGARGVVGHSYQLEIRLPDERIYRSAPEILPPVPPVDSLSFSPAFESFQDEEGTIQQKWFVNVSVATTLPPQAEGPYLRWEIETVYSFLEIPPPPPRLATACYIHEQLDPQLIRLYDGSRLSAPQSIRLRIGRRRVSWVFESKHYFNVYQSSLTKEAFRFWSDLNRVTNQVGSIFDTPPAAVRGNIRNLNDPDEQVLGYFGASALDTARIFTTPPELVGVPLPPRCGTIFGRPFPLPSECTNCGLIPNSTYQRPDYF